MKIAIVTGGSNGIGKGTALELGKHGVGVILTYYSDREAAEEVVRQIEHDSAVRAVALQLDLSQRMTFPRFSELAQKNLKEVWNRTSLDYLVNNGGVGGGMAFADIREEYFDRIFLTNFSGPFSLTQHLVQRMEDGGSIVNISSESSRQSHSGYSSYGPSKAALTSWTRYPAKELASRRIRVNAISPGPVHTHPGGGAFDKHPEYIRPLAVQTAFGRIGTPQDIANVVVSLLSDDFGWVTAQDITVSGGFML